MLLHLGILAFLIVAGVQQASAQTDPVRQCDHAAAERFDPDKPAAEPGFDVDKIDPGVAVPACEAAVSKEPGTGRLWYQLGLAQFNAGKPEEALNSMRTAAEKGHVAAFTGIGFMYMNGAGGVPKDPAAALANNLRAAEAGHAIAQWNVAVQHWQGFGVPRDPTAAEFWLQRASNQNFPPAMNDLAWAWVVEGRDLQGAEALAMRAVEAAPGAANPLDTLGWAIFKQGRHAEAVGYLEKATAAGAGCAPCHDHLGDALLATGNPRAAEAAWRRALALPDPNDPQWDRAAVEGKIAQVAKTAP